MNTLTEQLISYGKAPIKETDRGFEKDFLIPDTFDGFDGHFPGNPIMPAMAQLMLAQVAIEEKNSKPITILNITRAKFIEIVKPNSLVTVAFQEKTGDSSVSCKCKLLINDTPVSTFTITRAMA